MVSIRLCISSFGRYVHSSLANVLASIVGVQKDGDDEPKYRYS